MRWPLDIAAAHAFATSSAGNQWQIRGCHQRCQSEHSQRSRLGHTVRAALLSPLIEKANHGRRLLWALACRCVLLDTVAQLTPFFGIHADHRLTCRLVAIDQFVYFLKLLIAVGVATG